MSSEPSHLVLPVEEILASSSAAMPVGTPIGGSREGREITGYRLGGGRRSISLIAGCHADEPVGPAMLRRLVAFLGSRPANDPLLTRCTWSIVPDVNPDGAARNAAWSESTVPAVDHRGEPDRAYDIGLYIRHVEREAPGDDVEFGFPRDGADLGARPENRAVATFLAAAAPFHLHGSFHGMGFAPGPWFLIEPAWIDRTAALRDALRERVREMGYRPMDVDRGGEKGFRKIDLGFSTRPDSRAMVAFFEERGDSATAALFRPSSMELVRSLGGDPFTLVSEMPLFLRPDDETTVRGPEDRRLRAELEAAGDDADSIRRAADERSFRGMPIRDQMRLQLAFLNEAIWAVEPAV